MRLSEQESDAIESYHARVEEALAKKIASAKQRGDVDALQRGARSLCAMVGILRGSESRKQKAAARPGAKAKAKAKPKADAEAKPKPKPKADAKPKPKADAKAKPKPKDDAKKVRKSKASSNARARAAGTKQLLACLDRCCAKHGENMTSALSARG